MSLSPPRAFDGYGELTRRSTWHAGQRPENCYFSGGEPCDCAKCFWEMKQREDYDRILFELIQYEREGRLGAETCLGAETPQMMKGGNGDGISGPSSSGVSARDISFTCGRCGVRFLLMDSHTCDCE